MLTCGHGDEERERRVRVEKEKFDAVLSQLLKMDPIPTKQIKELSEAKSKAVVSCQENEVVLEGLSNTLMS
jgi:hypothetical protein